jgi:hypothetical protein
VMTKESSRMIMTHTEKTKSLRWQELGKRKGVKEVVVTWAYSVALVWLVWMVSERFVNEMIKWLDCQSNISTSLIIKGLDNQVQGSKHVCLLMSDYQITWYSSPKAQWSNQSIPRKKIDTHPCLWCVGSCTWKCGARKEWLAG